MQYSIYSDTLEDERAVPLADALLEFPVERAVRHVAALDTLHRLRAKLTASASCRQLVFLPHSPTDCDRPSD